MPSIVFDFTSRGNTARVKYRAAASAAHPHSARTNAQAVPKTIDYPQPFACKDNAEATIRLFE